MPGRDAAVAAAAPSATARRDASTSGLGTASSARGSGSGKLACPAPRDHCRRELFATLRKRATTRSRIAGTCTLVSSKRNARDDVRLLDIGVWLFQNSVAWL